MRMSLVLLSQRMSAHPIVVRGPHFSLADHLRRLPANVTLIGEIRSFNFPASSIAESKISLTNGTVSHIVDLRCIFRADHCDDQEISGVDSIILGTGYRYTYPFLPQYHNSTLGVNGTLPRLEGITQPLITDGTHVRSLYLDAFYIPDPTLLFINGEQLLDCVQPRSDNGRLSANFGMQSFTYAEFVSLAAAKVWSRTASLPDTSRMWDWYDKAVIDRLGFGRQFQFYGTERTQGTTSMLLLPHELHSHGPLQAALRFFVGWLNDAATKYGGRQIDNLPAE